MKFIKKIRIVRKEINLFSVIVYTENLKKEHKIIVKFDINQYKEAHNFGRGNQHVGDFIYKPKQQQDVPIRIYIYNYLNDKTEEIQHNFLEDLYSLGLSHSSFDGSFSGFDSSPYIEITDFLPGGSSADKGWCRGLMVNKIEGPFQNGKIVDEIDFNKKVSFRAYTGSDNLSELEKLSVKWQLTTPENRVIDPRTFNKTTISTLENYSLIEFYFPKATSFVLNAFYFFSRESELKFSLPSFNNPKTKVHFTIGMFFDGTGNNRFNSESVYYKNLDKNNMVNEKALKEKLKLTGTKSTFEVATDSSYWNPFSNVALLFDLYKTNNEKRDDFNIDVTLKQYVQGIGTIEGENDNMPGFAFGEGPHGIIGKVWEGCFKLSEEIKKNLGVNMEIGSLTFDVFGFSRGAASARHFCNEILGKQSIEDITESIFSENPSDRSTKNDNIQPPKTSKIMKPIGRKYKLGLLGKALQLQKIQHEVKYYEKPMNSQAKNNADLLKDIEKHRIDFENNAPVKIRFVGLFDTVVAQMIIKNHFGKKLDALNMIAPTPIPPFIGSLLELKLDKVRQKIDHLPIKQIVHLIAEDEYRENFASTKVGNAKHIFERRLPGAHSDLGGGYAAMKIDEDIVDYDYITHQTPELPNPKRLLDLKQFLINKGYCLSGEIEIKAIKTFNYTTRNAVAFQTLFQLIVTRSLTPRFSIVYLNVMKELCEKSGLVFKEPELDKKFEYITPPQLIKYERELIENLKSQFEGKSNKPVKKDLPKNLYVHLSSNFNKSKGIERYGAAITGNKDIDTLFYVNAPRYSNPKQDSYERETYTHPQ